MTVVRLYESGEEIEGYEGGDFLLTHGEYWTSRLIRFGQGLRTDKRYAWWNHAALVLNEKGDIAEALSDGVVCNNVSRYTPPACYLVKINASNEDRSQTMAFAESVLEILRSHRIRLADNTEYNPDVAHGEQTRFRDGRNRYLQRVRGRGSRQNRRDIG